MTTVSRTSRGARRLTLLGVCGLLALAPAAAMAQESSVPPVPVNPYDGAIEGSGAGKTIGYMSLGEFIPFVNLVTQGIAAEVAKSGATYIFCDTNIDVATTLACAQQMKTAGAQGVINFQVNQAQSPEFCAAYDNVPTIAIDIIQPPCEKVFFGANNHEAGRLAGAGIGKFAKDTWNCEYDAYVSLESVGAGAANAARMGGMRDGFTEYCPIINENIRPDDDRTDKALKGMTELLPALPGHRIVVTAINEDGILGAIGAANTLGRQADLFYAGQGADQSIWKDIACNPQYISSVAYFPEAYGKTVVPAMLELVDKKPVSPSLFTKHILINKDNIRTVYPATPAC